MIKFQHIVLVLALLLFSLVSLADSNKGRMELGNEAYKEGKYSEAIEQYEQILETGAFSKELYYNLGNAWYKSGNLSKAILYYEKALTLDPNDEDVLFNLGIANSQIVDEIDAIPEGFFSRIFHSLWTLTSSNNWARTGLLSFIILIVSALLYLMNNKLWIRRVGFYLGILALVVSIVSGIFARKTKGLVFNNGHAIVFTPTVNVKSAPDQNGTNLFILHEGTKVALTDSLANWYEIKLADGNSGWLLKTDVRKI